MKPKKIISIIFLLITFGLLLKTIISAINLPKEQEDPGLQEASGSGMFEKPLSNLDKFYEQQIRFQQLKRKADRKEAQQDINASY